MRRFITAVLFAALLPCLPSHAEDGMNHDHNQGGGSQHSHSRNSNRNHSNQRASRRNSNPNRRQNGARGGAYGGRQRGYAGGNRGAMGHAHFAISPALRGVGVTHAPHLFTRSSQIMSTNRAHSAIEFPHVGFGGHAIIGASIGGNHFNDGIVRTQMNFIGHNAAFRGPAFGFQLHREGMAGHYYWHHFGGFDYCHYNDPWGYSWFGWYVGPNYFWTRYWSNRFWFYDNGFNRWCYWSDGNWWWQNPYNPSAVYVYDNDQYIPATDSAPVEAEAPGKKYLSDDGTCLVKVEGATNDAYLLDTRQPAVYQPLLLASGVTAVRFYEPKDASPIQIMLTLADGSIKMFDDQGSPMNFETKAAQPEDTSAQPNNAPNQEPQQEQQGQQNQPQQAPEQAQPQAAPAPQGQDGNGSASPGNQNQPPDDEGGVVPKNPENNPPPQGTNGNN